MSRGWIALLPAIGLSFAVQAAEPGANTKLMVALWARDHEGVVAALKAGASPNYVAPFSEFKPNYGPIAWAADPLRLISALGLAARLDDLLLMDDLMRAGANINLHARADDTNLPSGTRKADLPSGPMTSLDMTKLLIQRGYRPTVEDISTALEVRETPSWKEWSEAVLGAPGVERRVAAIEAGTDPEYQKYNEAQEAERSQSHRKTETEAYEGELEAAQQAAQAAKYGSQLVTEVEVGDLVCSKPGVYHTKYVAFVTSHNGTRLQLRIVGGYNRGAGEFHSQEMRWDDVENWTACRIR